MPGKYLLNRMALQLSPPGILLSCVPWILCRKAAAFLVSSSIPSIVCQFLTCLSLSPFIFKEIPNLTRL